MKARPYSAYFLVFFLYVCFFMFPHTSQAATLYIDPYSIDVLKGDTVTVAVRLDTDEGECVNTVDATLSYSPDIQAIDVSRGRSILSLWIEEPTIKKEEHTITFAGGITNGYCGRIPGDPNLTNVVAEIVFRSPGFTVGRPQDISALVTFDPGTRVLLNDGLGTDAHLSTIGGTINLLQEVGTTTQDAWRGRVDADTRPPQPFGVELVTNPEVFSGKYYVVFNTTDKQTGMDHYEAIEESRDDLFAFRWGGADAPWKVVESPYVLKDQTLSSVIRVKAVDKAGNERVTVLIPDDTRRPLDTRLVALIGGGILALLLIVSVGMWWLIRRYKRKKLELGREDIPR